MKNKNLLILCPSFPDKDNINYGGIFIREYIDSIKHYFNNIYVISPVSPFKDDILPGGKGKFLNNYTYDNIKIFYPRFFYIPYFSRKNLINNTLKSIDKLLIKNNINFDIIHSHFTYPSGYLGVKLKEKYNKPLITTIHENGQWLDNEINSNNFKLIESWNKADYLVRVNEIDVKKLTRFNNNLTYFLFFK